MATYYVGKGGNDGNNGTTWALRKLTLNGAEILSKYTFYHRVLDIFGLEAEL